jgi:hypothetical protein
MVRNRKKNSFLLFPVEISFYKIADPEQYEKCRDSRNDVRSHFNTASLLPIGYNSEVCTIRREACQQVPDDVAVNNDFTNNHYGWDEFGLKTAFFIFR